MALQETGGGGRRNKMTKTCTEQGWKQALSAEKNRVEAVAAAKSERTDVYICIHRHTKYIYMYYIKYEYFNVKPPTESMPPYIDIYI